MEQAAAFGKQRTSLSSHCFFGNYVAHGEVSIESATKSHCPLEQSLLSSQLCVCVRHPDGGMKLSLHEHMHANSLHVVQCGKDHASCTLLCNLGHEMRCAEGNVEL